MLALHGSALLAFSAAPGCFALLPVRALPRHCYTSASLALPPLLGLTDGINADRRVAQ
jgi:hypothetical protein